MTRIIRPALSLLLPAALLAAPSAQADEGWFLGGNIGMSGYSSHADKVCQRGLSHAGLTGTCAASKGQMPIRLFAGYHLSELYGVEAGYTMLGNSSYTADVTAPQDATLSGKVKTAAFNADIFVKFYPAARYTMSAKLGAYSATSSITSSATGPASNDDIAHSSRNSGIMLGLGGAYELSPNYSASLELDQYKAVGEANASSQSNVNVILLGLTYTFR
jgi:hypothetical protein